MWCAALVTLPFLAAVHFDSDDFRMRPSTSLRAQRPIITDSCLNGCPHLRAVNIHRCYWLAVDYLYLRLTLHSQSARYLPGFLRAATGLERIRRFELLTNSLEGCHSTAELYPHNSRPRYSRQSTGNGPSEPCAPVCLSPTGAHFPGCANCSRLMINPLPSVHAAFTLGVCASSEPIHENDISTKTKMRKHQTKKCPSD